MTNVSNAWTDSYVTLQTGDIIFMEFQYDPVRNSGRSAISTAWHRDVLAAAAGIRLFYDPVMKRSDPPHPGVLTYGDALLGSVAWTLATRTDESLLFLANTANPMQAGWDTLTWHGCIDVVKSQLGHFTSDPYTFVEGTDPTGKPYRVWARDYENGLVLVRNRGDWNEGIEPETAVPVPLPRSLSPVAPSGDIGQATSSILMRNGTGAILLRDVSDGPPFADFAGIPISGTAPLTVNFSDNSSRGPTSWSWTFGDGDTSPLQNPSHTYSAAGTYTVALTATNATGSDTETKVGYVTVTAAPLPPAADFTGSPTSGVAPLVVIFTDHSTNTPTSWSWTFGDGGTSTLQSPSYTYSAAGTYTVALTATNATGSDTETKIGYTTVTAAPLPPAADFTGSPTSDVAPLAVVFTDHSTNAPTSWSWTFGDGGTSTLPSPGYTYNAAGTYTVALTATNATGSDTETKVGYITVTAAPLPPAADFTGSPTSGVAPLAVTFTDHSTYTPTSWSWTFGDGGTSTLQGPSHTYCAAGTYTVALTTTNAQGSDTETKVGYITVTAQPMPPVSDFFGNPTSSAVPLTVTFTDQSTNAPTSWSWTFGDGSTSPVQSPSHTYSAQGTYTVALTATNAQGSDTKTKAGYITVNPPPVVPPVAEFVGTPTTGTAPLVVDFTDQSLNTPSSWSWTFGDGDSTAVQNPRHTYSAPGTYTVALTATNSSGSNTKTKVTYITVSAAPLPPMAEFVGSPTSGVLLLLVTFTDQSANSPTSWSWTFGDGRTSTTQNPTHTYSAEGTYTVVLTATNAVGSDTRTRVDYVSVTRDNTTPLFVLAQNQPNPFGPTTQISFSIPRGGGVSVKVFSLEGKPVADLLEQYLSAGEHAVTWEPGGRPAGIYLLRLAWENRIQTRRMLLVR